MPPSSFTLLLTLLLLFLTYEAESGETPPPTPPPPFRPGIAVLIRSAAGAKGRTRLRGVPEQVRGHGGSLVVAKNQAGAPHEVCGHTTCPLCRYRVDPEDILLVEDAKPFRQSHQQQRNKEEERVRLNLDLEKQEIVESRRRHSSVGVGEGETTEEQQQSRRWTTSFRRSLDSISATSRKKNESVGVGCFVRPRKDGMLLTQETERASVERRLEHRIIVSGHGPRPGPRSVWARAAVERLAGFGPAVSDVGDDNDEGQLEWQREWCLRSGD
ncbi:RING-H2 finger protein ATL43 [Glycine soja]|nr:RING-H2 finger protein ATL43 [Glycine soja]